MINNTNEIIDLIIENNYPINSVALYKSIIKETNIAVGDYYLRIIDKNDGKNMFLDNGRIVLDRKVGEKLVKSKYFQGKSEYAGWLDLKVFMRNRKLQKI